MEHKSVYGFYSEMQQNELKEYYTCKNKVGDNIICTIFKRDENIEDLKKKYPDIIYQGYITNPINKTEIKGRFLIKFEVIKPLIL